MVLVNRNTIVEPTLLTQPQSPPESPYSHGLEKIYALETVDVSTVRPMGAKADVAVAEETTTTEKPASIQKRKPIISTPRPLTFDLNDRYRGWMEPLVQHEPIQVLGLGTHALRAVLATGVTSIGDLLAWRDQDSAPTSIGAGHYDEAMQQLDRHLAVSPLCWEQFDSLSLLRCLLGASNPSVAHLIAKPYGLEHSFPLTAAQEMDLRRSNEEELRKKALEEVDQEQCERAKQLWKRVIEVFCKPWMESRAGIATAEELTEYLGYRSLDKTVLEPTLQLLEEVYLQQSPFSTGLESLGTDLFAVDEEVEKVFRQIEKVCLSYFYAPSSRYPLGELITYLQQEFCTQWVDHSISLVEKVLLCSPQFLVYRDDDGHQTIIRHFMA
jgi:hypothetical protein